MSRLSRFIGVLRRNPKKSIFFTAVITYASNYIKEKYEEKLMMRELCEEAETYGEVPKRLGDSDRHITVLLNPAANGGKGKALFDKYCAPLLHLSGMKVAIVRTEHEGQARDLMEIMDNTTAVIVAGGDGTLAEVLTGLLRRNDSVEASKRFPLGVLPLGSNNTASSAVWGFTDQPKPYHLAEATMAIIRNIKRPLDVMQVTPLQDSTQEVAPKPVYAASLVEWSAYRDAAERKDIYWYWAFLKKYMTYVFSSYKDISWNCSAEIEYTEPCSGCSRCRSEDIEQKAKTPEPVKRWWMAYLPRAAPIQQKTQEEKIDYSSIINEDCGNKHTTSINGTCELTIHTRNTPDSLHVPNYALSLKSGPLDVGTFDFIREGWRREWSHIKSTAEEKIVGELTLKPTGTLKTKEGKERELNIDSETFEVRPMNIKVKPDAVTIFAPLTPPFAAG